MKSRPKRGRWAKASVGLLSKVLRPAHGGSVTTDLELRGLDEIDEGLADGIDKDEHVPLAPVDGERSPDEAVRADIARMFCARSGRSKS